MTSVYVLGPLGKALWQFGVECQFFRVHVCNDIDVEGVG